MGRSTMSVVVLFSFLMIAFMKPNYGTNRNIKVKNNQTIPVQKEEILPFFILSDVAESLNATDYGK